MPDNLTPNQGPFPSSAVNNPEIAPFLGLRADEMLLLGPVSETVAIGSEQMDMMKTPQSSRNLLMQIRASFPYLPILPIPDYFISIELAANVAQDIAIPSEIVMGMVLGSGAYYMSNRGRAEIPVAANQSQAQSIYKPDRIMFYLAGCKAMSFISATANTPITFMGYTFTELPR